MFAFGNKWFPGREADLDCLAEAVFLESDYWEKMRVAITNGLVKAHNGK